MVGWLAQESGPIQARFGSGENLALWLIFGVSLVALLFAWYLVREVLAAPEGTEKMKEIARAIQEGAKAATKPAAPEQPAPQAVSPPAGPKAPG